MFGASAGSLGGVTRCRYTDSCIVRPARLAEGVGGNGSTSCGCIDNLFQSKGNDRENLASPRALEPSVSITASLIRGLILRG